MTDKHEDGGRYNIVRFYRDGWRRRIIKHGVTLEEAKRHCADPETSSETARSAAARRRTREKGPWLVRRV